MTLAMALVNMTKVDKSSSSDMSFKIERWEQGFRNRVSLVLKKCETWPYFLQTVISRAKTLRADSLLDSLHPQGVRWICQNLTFPRVQSASFKLELTNFHLPPTLGLAIIKLINFDHEIHLNTIERFGTNQDHRPFLLRKLKTE